MPIRPKGVEYTPLSGCPGWRVPAPDCFVARRSGVHPRATRDSLDADEPDLFAVPGGPLTLERTDRFANGLRAMLRPPAGPALHRLGVFPDGDVALTAEDSTAADFLGWAPGDVGWSTDSCQFVSDATPAASTDLIPRGTCLRTEATFGVFDDVRPAGHPLRLPMLVRCLTAPGRICRIDVRIHSGSSERLARRVAQSPFGASRVLHIRPRRAPLVFVVSRVVDRDGRRRVAVML